MATDKDMEKVLAQIDREELANLALTLANFDAPTTYEKEVGEFVENWLKEEGFKTRNICMVPERPNIVGIYKGSGGGYSLLFNAHLDTCVHYRDVWIYRDLNNPINHSAWREGDTIYGEAVLNDRGNIACFLTAARAIKKAGITLKGDLLLTAVSGEMEQEPVDEFQGLDYISPDLGARFMVAHGAVADYGICAEGTNFRLGWVQTGRSIWKITLYGAKGMYSPFQFRPYTPEKNPSAIFQMGRLIDRIERWALDYERKHTYECPGGTSIPKVNLSAVRGGGPYFACMTAEICRLYLEVRIVPGQDIMALQAELEEMASGFGVEQEVELFVYRRGYEAQNVDRIAKAVTGAHERIFNAKPTPVIGPESSMWRDMNVFNEAGIPCVNYGPGEGGAGLGKKVPANLTVDELLKTTQVFALSALDICNQEKKKPF